MLEASNAAAFSSVEAQLLAALGESPPAWAVFQAMPPSHRQRWQSWVGEAKRQETRSRRIAKCVQELSQPDYKPPTTAYSGTPLLRKLGIDASCRVALLRAPEDLPEPLTSPPAGIEISTQLIDGRLDVIVLFARSLLELETYFGPAAQSLDPAGGLWVAWPKRSSGVVTDLMEDIVRQVALANGLVDNKVCAIDEIWSGLRCVYRRADRPKLR